MRKNRFKLLLVSAMLAAGMTACGKKDDKKEDTTTATATETTVDPTTEATSNDTATETTTEASTSDTQTTQSGINTGGNGISTSGFNIGNSGNISNNGLTMNNIGDINNGLNQGGGDITVNDEICKAYLVTLKQHSDVINAYTFQYENARDSELVPADGVPHPIAFSDVNGSGVRDLLYIYSDKADTARLSIFSFMDSDAYQIYDEYIDVQAGGASSYCLFKVKGNDNLFIYRSYGDQNWTNSISELSFKTYPFTKVHEYDLNFYYDETTGNNEILYKIDDKDVTQNEFLVATSDIYDNITEVLLYNGYLDDNELIAAAKETGLNCLSYENACAMLETGGASQNGNFVDPDGNNNNDPDTGNNGDGIEALEDMPTLYFSSGAGGWATVLEIDEEGTFDGVYYDSNMGETGDGYPNGTIYICEFSGQFTDIKKVSDYEYTMRMQSFTPFYDAGQEWIADDVRYVVSPPYGLETDTTTVYTLYLPGADTSKMSEDFLSWVGAPLAVGVDEIPNPFPYYGLYNPTSGTGFWGDDGE